MITEKGKKWLEENGYDGHTIWKPSFVPFSDLGLDASDKKRLVQTYKSDTSDPKSTIFRDGKIVKDCEGVYALSLISAIAGKLGVGDTGSFLMGRGSRARALCAAILAKLNA